MNVRDFVRICLALATALTAPFATAVGLTITDTCSRSLAGSATFTGPPVNVDSAGNISVSGYSASGYAAGLGQCDALPGDGKPVCTLSASQEKVAKGATVTLFAKCTASTSTFTWSGPASGPSVAPSPGTTAAVSLTFPNAGSYTYHVMGTSTGAVAGWTSAPVTILVGDAGDTPNCRLTLSPASILQNASSNIRVVCQPEATTYAWDAAESGAPASPGAGTSSTVLGPFASFGAFTYKVAGTNVTGTGPKTAAMVSVASNLGCTPGSVTYDLVAPNQFGYSQEFLTNSSMVIAMSFSLATNATTTFNMYQVGDYTNYYPPTMQWSVSRCKGDFTAPGACTQSIGPQGNMMVTANPALAGYCMLQAGVTYYMNMKQTACSPSGPAGCGMKIYRN